MTIPKQWITKTQEALGMSVLIEDWENVADKFCLDALMLAENEEELALFFDKHGHYPFTDPLPEQTDALFEIIGPWLDWVAERYYKADNGRKPKVKIRKRKPKTLGE